MGLLNVLAAPSAVRGRGLGREQDHLDAKSPRSGTGGPKGGTSYDCNGETVQRDGGGNIPDELIDQMSNKPGTFSMANTGQPNSGG